MFRVFVFESKLKDKPRDYSSIGKKGKLFLLNVYFPHMCFFCRKTGEILCSVKNLSILKLDEILGYSVQLLN